MRRNTSGRLGGCQERSAHRAFADVGVSPSSPPPPPPLGCGWGGASWVWDSRNSSQNLTGPWGKGEENPSRLPQERAHLPVTDKSNAGRAQFHVFPHSADVPLCPRAQRPTSASRVTFLSQRSGVGWGGLHVPSDRHVGFLVLLTCSVRGWPWRRLSCAVQRAGRGAGIPAR